jgi:hypothetical protein
MDDTVKIIKCRVIARTPMKSGDEAIPFINTVADKKKTSTRYWTNEGLKSVLHP